MIGSGTHDYRFDRVPHNIANCVPYLVMRPIYLQPPIFRGKWETIDMSKEHRKKNPLDSCEEMECKVL
jgi:hypothetical protein